MISKEQLQIIRDEVDRHQITLRTLKEDLIDHLCCLTEDKMEAGISFEFAWKEAMIELAPEGLYTIQQDTIIILKSPNIIFMKKLMYTIGLVGTIGMSMGFMFKILHMPGGDQLLNFGFLTFILLFLPLQAWDRIRTNMIGTAQEKWRFIFGCVSALGIAMAIVFKIGDMLVPAEIFFMSGSIVFSFGFLPLLFSNLYRKSVESNI